MTDLEVFKEILGADDGYIDEVKLRDYSTLGIPNELRGEVWLLLLNVLPLDRTQIADHKKGMHKHYDRLVTAVDDAMTRTLIAREAEKLFHRHPHLREAVRRNAIFNTLGAYLNHHNVAFEPYLLQLLGPLSSVISSEAELYYAFRALIRRLGAVMPLEMTLQLIFFVCLFFGWGGG
eukprot:m.25063 g.25063  ORF g.25063 m.25063 type:complete len:177 (+) comp7671_c0_seq1:192-722(+)